MTQMQTVYTSAGADEDCWMITLADREGLDVSSVVVQISLGTFTSAGAWRDPDFLVHPSESTIDLSVTIGGDFQPAPGRRYPWLKIVDGDKTYIRRCQPLTIA